MVTNHRPNRADNHINPLQKILTNELPDCLRQAAFDKPIFLAILH